MGGVIGEKVGMGRDGPELDPPESTNPATGLIDSINTLRERTAIQCDEVRDHLRSQTNDLVKIFFYTKHR